MLKGIVCEPWSCCGVVPKQSYICEPPVRRVLLDAHTRLETASILVDAEMAHGHDPGLTPLWGN